MKNRIINKFSSLVLPLIRTKKDDKDYVFKTLALIICWLATTTVMWLYVLYCYQAFGGWQVVSIGGLIFTIIHTLAPIVFYLSQSHASTSVVISLTGLGFQTLFCVYSGGVFSPAAIWLALHPVIIGFFGSTILIYISVFLNAVIILSMYILGHYGILPADMLPIGFRNSMIISSFIGLDILVATFTIAAIKTYTAKNIELQKSKELTENLIRILAHDINNPLTILRFYGPEMHKDPQKFTPIVAERINKASEDIQRITESVSMWIAHRDGKMHLNPEPLDTKDLVHHLNLTFEERLKKKNLCLKINAENCARKFLGDRDAVFYQVFNNLISNAIKFSFENSEIDLHIKEANDSMIFQVRDRGIGISDELADKVFSPYSKTNRKGTANETGTGFGLPIVGTIVGKLNGTIKIENAKRYQPEDQGTIITVTFPLVS